MIGMSHITGERTLIPLGRPGKTDPRSEIRTERPGPILDPTPEICLPESGPETRIDPNRTISDPEIFHKVACLGMTSVFNQKLVDPNSTRTEPYPIRNVIYPEHDPPELNPTHTRTE